jgi:hypothetical protein
MFIAGLCLDPWALKLAPTANNFEIPVGNQQTPAPTMPNPLKKNQPPDRICSLACSLMCKNPHGHTWSVGATVCHSVLIISKFMWENSQSPVPTWPDPLRNNQPPDRICSLTSSLICTNPHVHSWSVAGSVPPQKSPPC